MNRGTRRAFTLIELMISIAIIAIMFAIATSTLMEFGALQRQKKFQASLEQSSNHFDYLRKADFHSLPPEVKTVGSGGVIVLSQDDIIADSVIIRDSQTGKEFSVANFSSAERKVRLEGAPVGASLVVDYDFYLPAENVCCFADEQGKVQLESLPELRVHRVSLAKGETLEELSEYKLVGKELLLPSRAANGLVVIDLQDEQKRNRVSGEFLGQDLSPRTSPSSTKILQVQEPFQGAWKMSLPFLKEARS